MNRRNVLKGAVGATAATLVPVTATSLEDEKRAIVERLAQIPEDEAFPVLLCSMSLRHGHKWHDQTRAWLDQGVPVAEVVKRNLAQSA